MELKMIQSDVSDLMSLNKFSDAQDLMDQNYKIDVTYGDFSHFNFAIRYENKPTLKMLFWKMLNHNQEEINAMKECVEESFISIRI